MSLHHRADHTVCSSVLPGELPMPPGQQVHVTLPCEALNDRMPGPCWAVPAVNDGVDEQTSPSGKLGTRDLSR